VLIWCILDHYRNTHFRKM